MALILVSEILYITQNYESYPIIQSRISGWYRSSINPELSLTFCRTYHLNSGREELSHLPLLEHFIRIRNWIFDRLDGALPQQYLEEPRWWQGPRGPLGPRTMRQERGMQWTKWSKWIWYTRPGKHTKSYWKWPIEIDGLPWFTY